MKEYLVGFVIGPIYDTITKARKIEEHWLASFLFSEISKELLKEITNLEDFDTEIYSPALSTPKNLYNKDYLGKYPDQIIFSIKAESEEIVKELLEQMVHNVKTDEKEEYYLDSIQANYFRIDYAVIEAFNYMDNNKNNNKSDLECLMDILAVSDNGLSNYELYDNLFINDFKDNTTDKRFEEFKQINKVGNKRLDSITNLCSNSVFKDNYLLVYYDGNNVGVTLKDLYVKGEKAEYIKKSQELTDFSEKVSNLTDLFKKYYALPLFIAGDDGFFLMPVDAGGNYYMDFLKEINKLYKEEVGSTNDELTLRFSVVMAEVNMPFKELYDEVRNKGLYECKSIGSKLASTNGNNVLFKVIRSGAQPYAVSFAMDNEPSILTQMLQDRNSNQGHFNLENDYLPNSMYGKLDAYDYILEDVIGDGTREKAFLENIIELSKEEQERLSALLKAFKNKEMFVLDEKSYKSFDEAKLQSYEQVFNLGKIMNYLDKRKK